MAKSHTLEVPIKGMDCAECTQHVQHAIAMVPGFVKPWPVPATTLCPTLPLHPLPRPWALSIAD